MKFRHVAGTRRNPMHLRELSATRLHHRTCLSGLDKAKQTNRPRPDLTLQKPVEIHRQTGVRRNSRPAQAAAPRVAEFLVLTRTLHLSITGR